MSAMPEVLDNLLTSPKRFVFGGVTAAVLAATAAWVAYRANRAEHNDLQSGTFMDVDGTRIHSAADDSEGGHRVHVLAGAQLGRQQ